MLSRGRLHIGNRGWRAWLLVLALLSYGWVPDRNNRLLLGGKSGLAQRLRELSSYLETEMRSWNSNSRGKPNQRVTLAREVPCYHCNQPENFERGQGLDIQEVSGSGSFIASPAVRTRRLLGRQ